MSKRTSAASFLRVKAFRPDFADLVTCDVADEELSELSSSSPPGLGDDPPPPPPPVPPARTQAPQLQSCVRTQAPRHNQTQVAQEAQDATTDVDDGGWGDGVDRSASRKALFPPGFRMHMLRRPEPRNDVSPRRSELQPEPRAASEPGEAASEPAESVGEGEGEAASERLDRWLGKVVAPPTTVRRILRNEAILASKKRTRMQYETDAGAAAPLGRPAGLGATSSGRSW